MSSSPLGALHHREFRLLFAGLTAGNLAHWMENFAMGWLLVQLAIRDGNPALAGLYVGLRSIGNAAPALCFGLFAGVYADRLDRRVLLVVVRFASAAVATALAIVVITGQANIVVVVLLSATSAAVFAFDPPLRHAMLASVVPAHDLFSAMGVVRASQQVAQSIGSLIAGMLVTPLGLGGVFLSRVAVDMAAIGAVLPMRGHPADPDARAVGVLSSLREGIDHIRGDSLLRSSVILQIVFGMLALPFAQLLPVLAVESLDVGAVELSWLVASMGVGALIGALLLASAGSVRRIGVLALASMLAIGVLLVLLGLQRDLAPALVILTVLGALQQLVLGTHTVILQLAAPNRLRARVVGIQSVINLSFPPFGVLTLGTLATFVGISTAILVAGTGVVAVALWGGLRFSVIRHYRQNANVVQLQRTSGEQSSASMD